MQDKGPDSFTLFSAAFTVDPHYVTLIEKYQVTNNQRGYFYITIMLGLIIAIFVVLVGMPFHSLNTYIERIQSLYSMIREINDPDSQLDANQVIDHTKE